MSWELVAVLAVITYASRAASLVLLPSLPHALRVVLDRMPAALFAGLAVNALLVPGGAGFADLPIIGATCGALIAAPLRSLPICLVAGVAAYLLVGLLV